MTNPFNSMVGGQSSPDQRPQDSERNGTRGGEANNRKSDADTPDNVIPLRSATTEQSPNAQYLDQSVDLEDLPIPFSRFPGTKMVLPDREAVCSGWSAFVEEVAPDPAPIFQQKDRVPYYIAGTLKEAELSTRNCGRSGLKMAKARSASKDRPRTSTPSDRLYS